MLLLLIPWFLSLLKKKDPYHYFLLLKKMRCLFSVVFYEYGIKISFPDKIRDGSDGDSDEDYDDFQTRWD